MSEIKCPKCGATEIKVTETVGKYYPVESVDEGFVMLGEGDEDDGDGDYEFICMPGCCHRFPIPEELSLEFS